MSQQNGKVPDFSQFRLPPVYEWVECEKPEVNEGLTKPLRIKVLVNPRRSEVVSLAQQVNAIFDRARKKADSSKDESFDADGDTRADVELFDLIGPRIVDWNVEALNGDGEVVTLPAPAEAGGVVVELLNVRQKTWILTIVQSAHLGGDTRSKLAGRPAATARGGGEKTPSGKPATSTPSGASRPKRRKRS